MPRGSESSARPSAESPQRAGDVDVVAYPGAAAGDRSVGCEAGEKHVDDQLVRGAGVAPHERYPVLGGHGVNAANQRGCPLRGQVGQGQGQEEIGRPPAPWRQCRSSSR